MPDSKLIAIITALSLISSTGGSFAQNSLARLQQLEQLIVRKDCGGMRNFISDNPDLTQGNDPLAVELRSYANKLDNGLINCFAAPEPGSEVARDEGSTDTITGGQLTSSAIY